MEASIGVEERELSAPLNQLLRVTLSKDLSGGTPKGPKLDQSD
jgi:hypothetical protein